MRIGAHKGIKRVHIDRQLGCTLQTVTDMLYGRRLIKPYEIPVIALALGVTIDELFAAGQEQEQKRDYGSNNYKESAIRQWLNSSAAAGSVWTPQNDFDRPPNWAADTAGFMYGMDADFLAVIGETAKVTARNTVTDSGGYDETDNYFFLPSRSEVYGGVEVNNVNEGEPYPCYSDYSDLGNTAGTGEDSNRIKYRSGTAQVWWMRTPYAGHGSYVRDVDTTGAVSGSYASSKHMLAPVCCII